MRSSAGLVRLAVSPCDLGRDELLVDAELADAGEDAGKRRQHAADVIDAVHVRGIEPGDHRIEARALLRRKRPVDAGDVGVGERVVVERRVAVQVVGRREVARVVVGPLLLQRNAEQGRSSDARAHDLEIAAHADAFLHVVGQVEVRIVERVLGGAALRGACAPASAQRRAARTATERGEQRGGRPVETHRSHVIVRSRRTSRPRSSGPSVRPRRSRRRCRPASASRR